MGSTPIGPVLPILDYWDGWFYAICPIPTNIDHSPDLSRPGFLEVLAFPWLCGVSRVDSHATRAL
jgi:hypothetical protein